MSPRLEKLQAACDLVADRRRAGVAAADIIAELVRDHGARHQVSQEPYSLRIAGVISTCTSSRDQGLLSNWIGTATRKLMAARLG